MLPVTGGDASVDAGVSIGWESLKELFPGADAPMDGAVPSETYQPDETVAHCDAASDEQLLQQLLSAPPPQVRSYCGSCRHAHCTLH